MRINDARQKCDLQTFIFFCFSTFSFHSSDRRHVMEANGPKDPVNCPEVSRSEGAPQKEKCGEKIQQGKKVYSNNKHTTQPQTFKAAWLTPKWLSSAHPETYQTHIYGCFFTVYDRGTVTSTQLWPTFDTKTWTQTQISTQLSFPPCCATDPVHAANARK